MARRERRSGRGRGPRRREAARPPSYYATSSGLGYDNDIMDGSEYTAEEVAWLVAVDRWRREHTPFPTLTDLLALLKSLGYRKVT